MDIGIYNAKYPFRKLIGFLLPYFQNVNPNIISLSLIPLGIITAFVYFVAPFMPGLYWCGVILIFIRMIVGTLDGLVAEKQGKQTAKGEILNRLAPESADILLMWAIILANPDYITLGILVLGVCWGISYTGLIGLVGHKKAQSVGPVGQTDKIAILILFSVLQFFSLKYSLDLDFMKLFLWWVLVGGLITIAIRCVRILKLNEY